MTKKEMIEAVEKITEDGFNAEVKKKTDGTYEVFKIIKKKMKM